MKKTNSEYIRDYKYGKIWKDVFARDKKCVLCSSSEDLCIDHILSVKQGGKSTLENMRVLCRKCNSKGAIKTLKPELNKQREYMKKWREANKDYFIRYLRNWRSSNRGYTTKNSNDFVKFYRQSQSA